MANYEVTFYISYAETVNVEAESFDEAEELAYEELGNYIGEIDDVDILEVVDSTTSIEEWE